MQPNSLRHTALDLWNEQKYFIIEELVPEKIYMARRDKCIELFQPQAIISLIQTRILADAPITVNTWHRHVRGFQFRGYRPHYYYLSSIVAEYETHNMRLSALLNRLKTYYSLSQHTLFNAFDYDVRGTTAEEFRNKLTEWKKIGKLPYLTGIELDTSWVHNDYRMSNNLNDDGLYLFNP